MQEKEDIRVQSDTIISRCMNCTEIYKCVVSENDVIKENLCVHCEKKFMCEWQEIVLRGCERSEKNIHTCQTCVDRECCEKRLDDCHRGYGLSCSRFTSCKRTIMFLMSYVQTSHGYCSARCLFLHSENLMVFSLQDIEERICKSYSLENARSVMKHLSSLQQDSRGRLVQIERAKDIILAYLPRKAIIEKIVV